MRMFVANILTGRKCLEPLISRLFRMIWHIESRRANIACLVVKEKFLDGIDAIAAIINRPRRPIHRGIPHRKGNKPEPPMGNHDRSAKICQQTRPGPGNARDAQKI